MSAYLTITDAAFKVSIDFGRGPSFTSKDPAKILAFCWAHGVDGGFRCSSTVDFPEESGMSEAERDLLLDPPQQVVDRLLEYGAAFKRHKETHDTIEAAREAFTRWLVIEVVEDAIDADDYEPADPETHAAQVAGLIDALVEHGEVEPEAFELPPAEKLASIGRLNAAVDSLGKPHPLGDKGFRGMVDVRAEDEEPEPVLRTPAEVEAYYTGDPPGVPTPEEEDAATEYARRILASTDAYMRAGDSRDVEALAAEMVALSSSTPPDWNEVRRARWIIGITAKGLADGDLDSISCLGYLNNARQILERVLTAQGESVEFKQ
jgi:hypothetical protein